VPVLDPHDAGHRHQDVEIRVPVQHLPRGGVDARGIRGVDLHGADAGMLGGDVLQQIGAPAADDDGVAPRVQREREGEADPAGGAGDEDGVSGDVHVLSLATRPLRVQRALIRGLAIPGSRRARAR